MNFSQRIGKEPIKTELEKGGLSVDLKNSLWNVVLEYIINEENNSQYIDYDNGCKTCSHLGNYFIVLWVDFFKWAKDTLPMDDYNLVEVNQTTKIVRNWYFDADWHKAFDFIEFTSSYHNEFQERCNVFLKREMSAYRFLDGILVQINSKEEIVELEAALSIADKFSPVKTHLKQAIQLLSDRKNPDCRNSIKESISAVESLSIIIANDEKATLGQALKIIEKKHQIPASLKTAFSNLYGYTSNEAGIRHALLEDSSSVDLEEARFMLITCSAFVNYLISKK